MTITGSSQSTNQPIIIKNQPKLSLILTGASSCQNMFCNRFVFAGISGGQSQNNNTIWKSLVSKIEIMCVFLKSNCKTCFVGLLGYQYQNQFTNYQTVLSSWSNRQSIIVSNETINETLLFGKLLWVTSCIVEGHSTNNSSFLILTWSRLVLLKGFRQTILHSIIHSWACQISLQNKIDSTYNYISTVKVQ